MSKIQTKTCIFNTKNIKNIFRGKKYFSNLRTIHFFILQYKTYPFSLGQMADKKDSYFGIWNSGQKMKKKIGKKNFPRNLEPTYTQ